MDEDETKNNRRTIHIGDPPTFNDAVALLDRSSEYLATKREMDEKLNNATPGQRREIREEYAPRLAILDIEPSDMIEMATNLQKALTLQFSLMDQIREIKYGPRSGWDHHPKERILTEDEKLKVRGLEIDINPYLEAANLYKIWIDDVRNEKQAKAMQKSKHKTLRSIFHALGAVGRGLDENIANDYEKKQEERINEMATELRYAGISGEYILKHKSIDTLPLNLKETAKRIVSKYT